MGKTAWVCQSAALSVIGILEFPQLTAAEANSLPLWVIFRDA